MTRKPTKGKAGGEEASTPSGPGGVEDLPERWSAQRKTELVLRLLRGEPLDAVSRESQVPARELTLARAKVGELTMRLELAEYLIEKRGFGDEWRRSRR
jgi:hypothetical protein